MNPTEHPFQTLALQLMAERGFTILPDGSIRVPGATPASPPESPASAEAPEEDPHRHPHLHPQDPHQDPHVLMEDPHDEDVTDAHEDVACADEDVDGADEDVAPQKDPHAPCEDPHEDPHGEDVHVLMPHESSHEDVGENEDVEDEDEDLAHAPGLTAVLHLIPQHRVLDAPLVKRELGLPSLKAAQTRLRRLVAKGKLVKGEKTGTYLCPSTRGVAAATTPSAADAAASREAQDTGKGNGKDSETDETEVDTSREEVTSLPSSSVDLPAKVFTFEKGHKTVIEGKSKEIRNASALSDAQQGGGARPLPVPPSPPIPSVHLPEDDLDEEDLEFYLVDDDDDADEYTHQEVPRARQRRSAPRALIRSSQPQQAVRTPQQRQVGGYTITIEGDEDDEGYDPPASSRPRSVLSADAGYDDGDDEPYDPPD